MSTPSSTVSAPASSAKSTGKPSKSKIIKLQLTSSLLARFEPKAPAVKKNSRSKSTTSNSPLSTPSNPTVEQSLDDAPSESNNATPAPNADTPSSGNKQANPTEAAPRRKGIPGPKPGSKRGLSLTADGLPKPRGKPGPKKKPRLGDVDPIAAKGAVTGVAPITTQKLGPRANQGAINAGLRALDRSGKPCRRWEKKGFQLKSFTGVQWDVPTWRAPRKVNVDENGDVKSDTTSISDAKGNNDSSAVSDKSNSGADANGTPATGLPLITASPAPAFAV